MSSSLSHMLWTLLVGSLFSKLQTHMQSFGDIAIDRKGVLTSSKVVDQYAYKFLTAYVPLCG